VTYDHLVLLWLLALPLICGAFVAALGPDRWRLARWLSLGTAIVTLALALLLAGRFMSLEEHGTDLRPPTGQRTVLPTFKPEFVPGSTADAPHRTTWDLLPFGKTAVQFYVGVDGLNVWLVVLTAVLFLPSVLVSWTHVTERVNEFFAWLLVLQTLLFGVFLAFDIVLFYTFFELSLVPLFFLIGIWGGPQRQYAARKFFIYTLAGSMLSLLGILGVVLTCQERSEQLTFSIPRLVELVHIHLARAQQEPVGPAEIAYWANIQSWVFLALTAGFAVKVPLIPFHTWLPLAHVEAPTAGSVDLAGILLKIGAYGYLRLCIPLAPDASLALGLPLVSALATIGIIYGALVAYSQADVKKLIAYSSVSHVGLCMLGMFTLNAVGLTGSLLQMINHGLSTGGLFLLIGMLYERYHTRDLGEFGGMAKRMPLFGALLVFICLSSAGLPGLNGFVSEFLCLAGVADYELDLGHRLFVTVLAASTIVLGAWYLFTMMRRLLFGAVREPHHGGEAVSDLKPREWLLLTPIVLLCVVLGVYPKPVIRAAQPDVDMVAHIANLARQRAAAPAQTTAHLRPPELP
jgi:NADH-quinone oxidoreductase subunit M